VLGRAIEVAFTGDRTVVAPLALREIDPNPGARREIDTPNKAYGACAPPVAQR
jgi:hypothetical protein